MSAPNDELVTALEDESAWADPQPGPPRKSEKRQRSAVVSVRMNKDELARVQALAEASGQTLGTYMRQAALGELAVSSLSWLPIDRSTSLPFEADITIHDVNFNMVANVVSGGLGFSRVVSGAMTQFPLLERALEGAHHVE